MANNKSSKKRIILNKKSRIQNNSYKSEIKTSVKHFVELIEAPQKHSPSVLKSCLNTLYSKIDKAVKKNILHKNTAARKKSKFSKLFNQSLL